MSETLVVSHDAGGAEVLSSWVRQQSDGQYTFMLAGPAKSIFNRKMISPFKTISEEQMLDSISCFDKVITSASWASSLEKQAIRIAKSAGVRNIMYLDHWCNFEQRIFLNSQREIADQIWVCDEYAREILEKLNPPVLAKNVGNFYFEDIKNEAKKYSLDNRSKHILYLSEPIRDYCKTAFNDPLYYGYDEFEALESFLKLLDTRPFSFESLRIRMHPSEAKDKYFSLINGHDFRIEISSESSLVRDCTLAQKIFGCDTMGLAIAVLIGKEAVSVIPPHGHRLTIPYKEISYLFQRERFNFL